MNNTKLINLLRVVAIVLLLAAIIALIINSTQKSIIIEKQQEKINSLEEKEPEETWAPSDEDVIAMTKTLYGECRGVSSVTQQAAVAWVILNRVDSAEYPNTVLGVVTQPNQFKGFYAYDEAFARESDGLTLESLRQLAVDVLTRHHDEKCGKSNVGRVLPSDYLYFVGDGQVNYFSNFWGSKQEIKNNSWDWSLQSPYNN